MKKYLLAATLLVPQISFALVYRLHGGTYANWGELSTVAQPATLATFNNESKFSGSMTAFQKSKYDVNYGNASTEESPIEAMPLLLDSATATEWGGYGLSVASNRQSYYAFASDSNGSSSYSTEAKTEATATSPSFGVGYKINNVLAVGLSVGVNLLEINLQQNIILDVAGTKTFSNTNTSAKLTTAQSQLGLLYTQERYNVGLILISQPSKISASGKSHTVTLTGNTLTDTKTDYDPSQADATGKAQLGVVIKTDELLYSIEDSYSFTGFHEYSLGAQQNVSDALACGGYGTYSKVKTQTSHTLAASCGKRSKGYEWAAGPFFLKQSDSNEGATSAARYGIVLQTEITY